MTVFEFNQTTTHNPAVAAALHDLLRLVAQCTSLPDEPPARMVRHFDMLFALAIRADSSLTRALKTLGEERAMPSASFKAVEDDLLSALSEVKLTLCIPEGVTDVPDAPHLLRRAKELLDCVPAKLAALEHWPV